MSQPMVSIRGLKKSYGPTQALKGVDFEVPKGQVVGFLGPNGAGKSTTMKVLAGYVLADEGVATVAGIAVGPDSVEARKRIGYLPENNPIAEDMMVLDFLRFVAEVRGVPKAQRRARLQAAIERCGLGGVLGKDIGQLSKGYRQRVGLAQAILHEPDLLILDEPTSGLDPNQIVEIRKLITELGREKTVILSTHILSEVENTCQRVLIINDGRLVADGAPEALRKGEGTVTVVVASRVGVNVEADKVRAVLEGVPGVTRVEPSEGEGGGSLGFALRYQAEDPRRGVFEAAVKHDLLLLEMRHQQVSLEDTFRKLTARAEVRP
ncbi:MAG: ABC transporter ATP-binding protein [Myxococcaceae bacterium]|nr:ABC transporter ATP-binding protein [Myxococcaceae bacterium]